MREILELHNQLRAQEDSSNMQMLVWNSTLARLARTWAEGCVYAHPKMADHPEYASTGQNLFGRSGTEIFIPDDIRVRASTTTAVPRWGIQAPLHRGSPLKFSQLPKLVARPPNLAVLLTHCGQ